MSSLLTAFDEPSMWVWDVSKMIVYQELFWLFMMGNVAGVIVEGLWCKVRYGKWQTHVVALWGPFNIVYGIGIAMFYVCLLYTSRKRCRTGRRSLLFVAQINDYIGS